jgi:diguanylate cyclase (GGDEF)-like protein
MSESGLLARTLTDTWEGQLTTPSDFAPGRTVEFDQPAAPDTRGLQQHIWISRIIGLGLLAGCLVVLGASNGFGSPGFAVASLLLIGLAAYVLIAETRTRRISLNLEKRLRLGLLVHNMELESMAMQDDLTQLFNRRYFFERLERQLETAKAFQRPLSVIIADLNSLKAVNDTHGHHTGDEVISGFGRFLLDHTRASDVPARIGGDEFAIILPDTAHKAALILKNRLGKKLEGLEIAEVNGVALKAEAAFGIASYPGNGESVDELVSHADADMYSDKREQHAVEATA